MLEQILAFASLNGRKALGKRVSFREKLAQKRDSLGNICPGPIQLTQLNIYIHTLES